jgi:ABC-type transport system involved in multi-copper enzyme maturation permease subunit
VRSDPIRRDPLSFGQAVGGCLAGLALVGISTLLTGLVIVAIIKIVQWGLG